MKAPTVDQALDLAARGMWVFPLRAGLKLPACAGWQNEATTNPDTIRKMWGDKPHNIGIYTAKFGDGQGLLVVDVDRKNGKDGYCALLEHELAGREFPLTLEHSTPSGGRHLLYTVPAPVRQGANVLGPGLDVRSRGGYVVAPGSVLGSGSYYVDRPAEITPAPQWLIDACGAARTAVAPARSRLGGIDPTRAGARAIAWMQQQPPVAVGERNEAGYRVAAKLKDFGVEVAQCAPLMLEHWACEPMLDADELQHVTRSAFAYGREPQGAEAPEAVFNAMPLPAPPADAPQVGHPFTELNKEYAVVAESPRTVAYRERTDPRTGQRMFERFTKQSFFDLVADRRMDGKPLGKLWWEDPHRRIYRGGVEFAPSGDAPPDTLNLWGGFAVQPAPGDWSLLREHIRAVICGGSAAVDAYVMDWLAHMVQKPGEPGRVALVLRGGRGTGKGTLGETMRQLFGRHAIHLSDQGQLAGRFSGHLACRVFVFADEAFFAGDRSAESRLKAIITEPTLAIEAKGADIVSVRNCCHVLMASNSQWVVPAGPFERRFCVVDVADTYQRDRGYFRAIREQLSAGGLGAMLLELQARDVDRFDPEDIPHTRAGAEQQMESLRGPERFLFEALNAGRVGCEDWGDTKLLVSKGAVYDEYQRHSHRLREARPAAGNSFWRALRGVFQCSALVIQDSKAKGAGGRTITLPPLAQARAAFEKFMGDAAPWE